jgi:hypothetical protein
VDDRGRKALGDKLVMHCRGPKETAINYNRYVVNGKLFRTQEHDVRKRTQNSGVCVTTVNGEIIEVEYYDRTKYILLKCDWADTTSGIGYKVNKYGLVLANFKKLVHRGELITDEPYVLLHKLTKFFTLEMNVTQIGPEL